MSKPLMAASFYTPNGYEAEVDGWRSSMVSVGLSCHVEEVENLGSWFKNCAARAEFLLKMLSRFGSEYHVLWVDIDARAKAYPSYLAENMADHDFAAVMRNGGVSGGTTCWANTEASSLLLSAWRNGCANGIVVEKSESHLRLAVESLRNQNKLSLLELPDEYVSTNCCPGRNPVVFKHDMAGFRYWGKARREQHANRQAWEV